MHPLQRFAGPRPWATAAPLGGYGLWRAARGMAEPYFKSNLPGNFSYRCLEALRECAYVLLCCWCMKELLD